MALRLALSTLPKRNAIPSSQIIVRTHSDFHYIRHLIGNREIVGYGFNGEPNYVDRPDFPFPSLRWKETTPELMALKEKEKGNWKALTMAEKKELYRWSYRQTFSEFTASTGRWKEVVGIALMCVSGGIWLTMYFKKFVNGPWPESYCEDNQKHQLRRMLDLHVNPMTGISSKWDYQRDKWKK